ncbi:MAG: hypothetical protein VX153_05105 [Verrucomicrobiota bacterium]|nr:hypothetical protein [Verrucomicrobiota bacterium]
MKDNKEIKDVSRIFQNLGAPEEQAMIMARQLIKRADQIAEEKNTSKIVELRKLLEIATLGAQGQTKPNDEAYS